MTGAWEVTSKHLYVGILHQWYIHPDWMNALLRLNKNIFGGPASIHYDWQHDKPYADSRNFIAKNFLDTEAEWLLTIDTDVLPPTNGLQILASHRLPFVSGLYWRRHPNVFPEVFRFDPGTTQYKHMNDGEVQIGLSEVDGVGVGFSLIHRRVFETLKSRVRKLTVPTEGGVNYEFHEFFKWTVAEPPFTSEDLFFCSSVRDAGYKIYLDSRVRCGHIISTMMMKEGRPEWTPLEVPTGF